MCAPCIIFCVRSYMNMVLKSDLDLAYILVLMITMVLFILLKSSLLQMARKVVAMLQLLILQRRLRQSSRLQNQEEHSLATRVTGTFVVSLFTLLLFDGSVTIYIALAGLSTQKLVCSLIRRQNTVMGNEVHGKVT